MHVLPDLCNILVSFVSRVSRVFLLFVVAITGMSLPRAVPRRSRSTIVTSKGRRCSWSSGTPWHRDMRTCSRYVNMARTAQIRPDQIKSDQIRSDQHATMTLFLWGRCNPPRVYDPSDLLIYRVVLSFGVRNNTGSCERGCRVGPVSYNSCSTSHGG